MVTAPPRAPASAPQSRRHRRRRWRPAPPRRPPPCHQSPAAGQAGVGDRVSGRAGAGQTRNSQTGRPQRTEDVALQAHNLALLESDMREVTQLSVLHSRRVQAPRPRPAWPPAWAVQRARLPSWAVRRAWLPLLASSPAAAAASAGLALLPLVWLQARLRKLWAAAAEAAWVVQLLFLPATGVTRPPPLPRAGRQLAHACVWPTATQEWQHPSVMRPHKLADSTKCFQDAGEL